MKDPQNIPDDLVERAARSMQCANALSMHRFVPWNTVNERQKEHWLHLAKCALLGVSIHTDTWPDLVFTPVEKGNYTLDSLIGLDREAKEGDYPFNPPDGTL